MTSLKVETFFNFGKDEDEALWETLALDLPSLVEATILKTLDHLFGAPFSPVRHLNIGCIFTDDDVIQNLNREHRGKDKPTNVLSFGYFEAPIDQRFFERHNPDIPILLGDIVLSYTKIRTEAEEQKKSFKNHFTHLLVHGLLHLLGYDHEHEQEALIMENLERDILDQMGCGDPYLLNEEASINLL